MNDPQISRDDALERPRITDETLAALADLTQAATPAPWTPALVHDATNREARVKYLTETLADGDDAELWTTWAADGEKSPDETYLIPAITGNGPTSEANAVFVANARNLIGLLITEIQERMAEGHGV